MSQNWHSEIHFMIMTLERFHIIQSSFLDVSYAIHDLIKDDSICGDCRVMNRICNGSKEWEQYEYETKTWGTKSLIHKHNKTSHSQPEEIGRYGGRVYNYELSHGVCSYVLSAKCPEAIIADQLMIYKITRYWTYTVYREMHSS